MHDLFDDNWALFERESDFLPVLRESRTRRFRPPLLAGIIDKMLLIDNAR